MKKLLLSVAGALLLGCPCYGQFTLKKALGQASKVAQAVTLSDEQMAAYVKESVDWMDKNNPVAGPDDAHTQRLERLTEGMTSVDGIPLNFKVYNVTDVNAFACPDGSVRVFSSLMDIMDDDELMGIIGHEIGHVAKRHSKNSLRQQLLTEVLVDGVASSGTKAKKLTESDLSKIGLNLIGARYSQKQEKEADDYGYEFLKEHGRNPWGMIKSFEKFLTLEGEGGQQSNVFQRMFSTHPETKARIKRLTERAQAEGIGRD